jgi:hypothetical protein
MTAPLKPHIQSDIFRQQIEEHTALLDRMLLHARVAEEVIAEARAIVNYWDAGLTVVQISALKQAIDAYDDIIDRT